MIPNGRKKNVHGVWVTAEMQNYLSSRNASKIIIVKAMLLVLGTKRGQQL